MRAFVVKRELQDALDAAVISAAQSELAQSRSKYALKWGPVNAPQRKTLRPEKAKEPEDV